LPALLAGVLAWAACTSLCTGQESGESPDRDQPVVSEESGSSDSAAGDVEAPVEKPCVESDRIPRFVENSPFDNAGGTPAIKRRRQLWADSWLWAKAPKLVVEEWIGEKPETKGKYVLIEFWATWCGPCRRSIPLLNTFHRKYGEELVVIGVCEEGVQQLQKLNQEYPNVPKIEFSSAVDTKKRMKDKLGVWGIPHVILLEPDGYVIWEGFPLQPGFELTETIIQRVLAVGRRLRAEGKN
jgi:thiol-disulfide isomerase/thioredoxin